MDICSEYIWKNDSGESAEKVQTSYENVHILGQIDNH